MPANLYVNAKARRGQEWFEQARTELTSLGVELGDARAFGRFADLQKAAEKAVESGAELVILGGGDGTFSGTAHLFANKPTTLGVLPLGTGNAFARDLGIPADIAIASRIIAEGHTEQADLGKVNDSYFVNVATVGLTTKIAQNLTNPMKKRFGRFVYAFATARAMMEVKPFRATLSTENGTSTFESLQVVIGSGRFHAGPFLLSPRASITDGKLRLYALRSSTKADFIKLALALPLGQQGWLNEVHSESTTGGTLVTQPVTRVTVDGEVSLRTPITFGIAAGAVRVLVPRL